jgi:hypothetical protein
MDKLLAYLVLMALMLAWVWLYAAAPPLQGVLVIATIAGVLASGCCRAAKEGR